MHDTPSLPSDLPKMFQVSKCVGVWVCGCGGGGASGCVRVYMCVCGCVYERREGVSYIHTLIHTYTRTRIHPPTPTRPPEAFLANPRVEKVYLRKDTSGRMAQNRYVRAWYGCVGVWVHGCIGGWMNECMGIRVWGQVCECI